jgi:O-antigen ligase
LFQYQYESFGQAGMGSSYSVVSVAIPALIHFWYYRKNTKLLEKVAYIYIAFLIICLCFRGNRGAVLSVFVCVVVLLFNIAKPNGYTQGLNPKMQIMKLVALFAMIAIILNLENIIVWITEALSNVGLNVPSFLSKSVLLMSQTNRDIDNGRSELYALVWQYIKQRPVFGYGIGTFDYYTNRHWPHNYILQVAFEGGVIFAVPVIAVSLIYFLYLIKQNTKEKTELAVMLLLFCECIPRYLISNDSWRGTAIWLMLGYGFVVLFRILHFTNRREILSFKTRR